MLGDTRHLRKLRDLWIRRGPGHAVDDFYSITRGGGNRLADGAVRRIRIKPENHLIVFANRREKRLEFLPQSEHACFDRAKPCNRQRGIFYFALASWILDSAQVQHCSHDRGMDHRCGDQAEADPSGHID